MKIHTGKPSRSNEDLKQNIKDTVEELPSFEELQRRIRQENEGK